MGAISLWSQGCDCMFQREGRAFKIPPAPLNPPQFRAISGCSRYRLIARPRFGVACLGHRLPLVEYVTPNEASVSIRPTLYSSSGYRLVSATP